MALNKKEIAVFEQMEMWEISQMLYTGIGMKLIGWEKVTDTLEWLACNPCKKCGTIPHVAGPKKELPADKLCEIIAKVEGELDIPSAETIAPGGSNEQQ